MCILEFAQQKLLQSIIYTTRSFWENRLRCQFLTTQVILCLQITTRCHCGSQNTVDVTVGQLNQQYRCQSGVAVRGRGRIGCLVSISRRGRLHEGGPSSGLGGASGGVLYTAVAHDALCELLLCLGKAGTGASVDAMYLQIYNSVSLLYGTRYGLYMYLMT